MLRHARHPSIPWLTTDALPIVCRPRGLASPPEFVRARWLTTKQRATPMANNKSNATAGPPHGPAIAPRMTPSTPRAASTARIGLVLQLSPFTSTSAGRIMRLIDSTGNSLILVRQTGQHRHDSSSSLPQAEQRRRLSTAGGDGGMLAAAVMTSGSGTGARHRGQVNPVAGRSGGSRSRLWHPGQMISCGIKDSPPLPQRSPGSPPPGGAPGARPGRPATRPRPGPAERGPRQCATRARCSPRCSRPPR